MQSDAYQEFLQENSRRNYPFVEDASLTADGDPYKIPTELLLNFRGFTRQQPEVATPVVQLVAMVGPDAGTMPGPFDSDPAGWTMIFKVGTLNQITGTPQYLRIVLGSTAPADTTVAFVPSAFGQDPVAGDMANHGLSRNPSAGNYNSGSWKFIAAMIQVTVAQEGLDGFLPSDPNARLYFTGAFIEPALMTNLWRTEIERLVIQDQCWPEADVQGRVVFREGYNMEIVRLGNSILLSPARRAGRGVQSIIEFESWLCDGSTEGESSSMSGSSGIQSSGSLSPDELRLLEILEPCMNNILRVNGVSPSPDYDFRILGGAGVTVQNFPNQHRIVINISIPQPDKICPDVSGG